MAVSQLTRVPGSKREAQAAKRWEKEERLGRCLAAQEQLDLLQLGRTLSRTNDLLVNAAVIAIRLTAARREVCAHLPSVLRLHLGRVRLLSRRLWGSSKIE